MQWSVGLTLSGGGARGIAHIGVIKALEELNIQPDVISGSSAGALVGVLYAAGCTSEEIYSYIRNKSLYSIVKMGIPDKGMMELGYFRNILKSKLPHNHFDQLRIPFYVAVTNLNKGGCEIVHSGEQLIDYVLASATIPLVFKPIQINGHLYVDGGVINNLPVEPLREKCAVLIGVNVNTVHYIQQVAGIRNVGMRCLDISLMEHVQARLQRCDIAIEPELSQYNMFDLHHADAIFEVGYEAAKRAIFAYREKKRSTWHYFYPLMASHPFLATIASWHQMLLLLVTL
jgi:NTE family protein